MTANHPYPKHVMEAVAVAILNYYEYLDGRDTSAVEIANVALTGLWEASQVDDVETMKTLPNDAVVRSDIGGEPYIPYNFIHAPYEEDYPAHVIWWGEHDDR